MRNLVIRSGPNRLKFKFLKWDTEFFGTRAFLLDPKGVVTEKGNKRFADAVSNKLRSSFVSAKVPLAASKYLFDFLSELGFKRIATDVVLEFDRKRYPLKNEPSPLRARDVTMAKAKTVPRDAYLLGKEFALSRFHLDGKISKEKADSVWVEFIKNFKIDARHHLFMARIRNRTIGGIFVKQRTMGGRRVSNLFSVSLKKKYRGKGIGSALIKYALQCLTRQSGIITVGTQSENKGALNFYRKNGFSKIRETKLILHRWSIESGKKR